MKRENEWIYFIGKNVPSKKNAKTWTGYRLISNKTVKEYETRLLDRIKQTLLDNDVNIDEQRVLTEVAVFSDKVAVAEETVRLKSHFEQLSKFLEADVPVGRKIDFIIQEMNREANTIGSKVQDAMLAHKVVDIKSEIEKIREQVQNIE